MIRHVLVLLAALEGGEPADDIASNGTAGGQCVMLVSCSTAGVPGLCIVPCAEDAPAPDPSAPL